MDAHQTGTQNSLSDQAKVISLFQFIQELNKLKQKAILNVKDYPWFFPLSDLPDDPENIHLHYQDRVVDDLNFESADDTSLILSVHKPEFETCPEPDLSFKPWLEPGWNNYLQDATVIFSISGTKTDEETGTPIAVLFSDDPVRETQYIKWLERRKEWANRQRIIAQTRDLFAELYRFYFELKRESETEEIIVANGFLCDRSNPVISHPVITHRVSIVYDPDKNTVSIHNTDIPTALYSVVFQIMADVNLGEINKLQEDLKDNDYHPLDRNDTPGFLKVLVHQLSSDSTYSENGIPADWEKSSRLLLYWNPCLIVRKRLDGTLKAIEQIVENVQETGEVPGPIRDIVSGGILELPEDVGDESIEEQLAAVGGESIDILLTKQANKEQLNIARRIEQYNAVLVQGPPGTGKTHTIANLMGHFLAQGKSILVTSYTTKALRVLKDKVDPGLQNLCVSMLDDSNADMERSIDGITEYMARTTSYELKQEMTRLAEERVAIISRLAETRRKLYSLIKQECNCIVLYGEEMSPSSAARFVLEHEEDLSYIPGKVRIPSPLPLSFEQFVDLYRSNEGLTMDDEQELDCGIPSPNELLSPVDFEQIIKKLSDAQSAIDRITQENDWMISGMNGPSIEVSGSFGTVMLSRPSINDVRVLKAFLASIGKVEPWMQQAAVDGKAGGAYRQRWLTLIDQIQAVSQFHESVLAERFGHEIEIIDAKSLASQKPTLETLKDIFREKGKVSKLMLMLHKEYQPAIDCAKIDGHNIQTAADCDVILHQIELTQLRDKCAKYWDELMCDAGVPAFFDLDCESPELVASNWIPQIRHSLDWYASDFVILTDKMASAGISTDLLLAHDPLDSDFIAAGKQFSLIKNVLPYLCDLCEAKDQLEQCHGILTRLSATLLSGKRSNSCLCRALNKSIDMLNWDSYAEGYANLEMEFEKYALQSRREEMLKALEPIAPDWANAIRHRSGIHGESVLPDTIEDAWKWKQLEGIIQEITVSPFQELQATSLALSKQYRERTARYAEKCAWYQLLSRTESNIDMNQALQGWKQTVKRIGKGTGKNAPRLKAEARKLMSQCQRAVPAWIMPINKALESLDPKENRFDIVIIDEASQSDISSLAILYMGRKLIIVGDDKQVSPLAVGVDSDKINALEQLYLYGKIPNSQLYNAKTSIYDIAATTFKPLMLREHFRCVPEIIGFSNMLSYDYQIKPLREASSTLLPAVVNYRVEGGQRDSVLKVNHQEAKAIVALMKACMEQPEYEGKTFGVISLLGDAQYQLIQREIDAAISPKEIVQRNILCGNSANFQGDERDVIFLSLVDSKDIATSGPLRLQSYGVDDSTRKRYNVAASRARDQLWVVHSLDAANDLKSGDIRKILLDYAANPHAQEIANEKIAAASESPFEEAVAKALSNRGYHLVQQWEVGAYRLDMVAICGRKTVAIECDGERWHSGDAKIREDMERQAILERLGWRFIRIRGSEFYRAPEQTIDRVIHELAQFGIEPEVSEAVAQAVGDTDLLSRVKRRAAELLHDTDAGSVTDTETIKAALNPRELEELRQIPALGEQSTQETSVPLSPFSGRIPMSKEQETAETLRRDTQSADNPHIYSTPLQVSALSSSVNPQLDNDSQQVIPGMEDIHPETDKIILLLKQHDIRYVDKRNRNGALWLLGGNELKPIVDEAKKMGITFRFKADGGKATKGAPGWWGK